MKSEKFDYIVIEASGICEPEPIAQTVCSIPTFGEAYRKYGICRLDCIVTVVDALRFQSEFACGDSLTKADIAEDDIENLIIQQVEFCNKILLNKASEVTPQELGRIRQIIKTIQPGAEIIECDYANIDLDLILNTRMFDFEKVATSAGWIRGIEGPVEEEEHHHHHGHECGHDHHHDHECSCGHHHHHGEGEAEEYGISTFVYYRRRAFDINKFDYFVAKHWPKSVIRAKGVCYFSDSRDMSYLFEQAGKQKSIKEAGLWYATAPADELAELMKQEPGLMRDWDPEYGDRMQKIVFIGQKMDKEQIIKLLDDCLE